MILKPIIYLTTGLTLFTVFPGCSGGAPGQQTVNPQSIDKQDVSRINVVSETISIQAAYTMITDNAKNPVFLLIDVRTPAEFAEKQIAGTINIDYHAADFKDKLQQLDTTKKILIYCRSGNRSGKTLPIMKELGFKEVYNMDGGLIAWESNNYPLVRQ